MQITEETIAFISLITGIILVVFSIVIKNDTIIEKISILSLIMGITLLGLYFEWQWKS